MKKIPIIKINKIWRYTRPIVRNKYIVTILAFVIWITFFDTYHLIDRIKDVTYLKELQAERDFFKHEIERYRTQINELRSDRENLEKFAREQHLMKRKNEDIFIILESED